MHRPQVWLVLGWMLICVTAAEAAPGVNRLKALYIRMPEGDFSEDLVVVEPVGRDVRVRFIRLSPVDANCPSLVVKAVEGVLPNTTVQAVAGGDVCSLSPRHIRRATSRAMRRYSTVDFFGSIDAIVAECDSGERTFVLKQPPILDDRILRRQAPAVAKVWSTGERVTNRITKFNDADPEAPFRSDEAASETRGTSLVPDLLTEKYTRLIPDYLVKRLERYKGPPAQRGPLPPELLDRESLGLTIYVAPVLSQIALSARVFNDVRLRLSVDRETGAVTDVEALTNPPLLVPAAIAAARQWRFAPATAPREPIDVTVSFKLRCAPESE
jgi:hypothetical protein